ncbi:MAG: L-seryl-tRNA(Sec) selenium transferase [Acidimicrobiaceae bacterium]|nr:L-seryl-tRNA(Sec) selenium transferase [Acidimicrobiaceae bacterium]MXZ98024.1 L-seryl-tRNA(Sec) selenium transferase [Acidimicrobiaceae bacterium]MYE75231.1 L-seryl-tRNA(Sec) selenium transferase [Acidimicrobiaceae bacterium]MYE96746.1 L-seryl-tRNA(Sec) selenium transferase [Acidimicrobiaceae bacterium]MYI53262.1 L-seryl-tRNA(Sec) selenium transferase [Acidimicrobiaceae bacterium]
MGAIPRWILGSVVGAVREEPTRESADTISGRLYALYAPTRGVPSLVADVPTQDRPPSVDRLARSLAGTGLPHALLVDAARAAVAAGDPGSAGARAERIRRRLLSPVINGTGVLLHTNLGRAPLAWSQSAGYSNLELDLETGERGDRQAGAPALLARACGAEAAMAVNNCASAVMLVLAALAEGRDAVVSRGELVEIGGGFRVPDVMAWSGARLVEVGTTNRTRRADFAAAVADGANDVAVVVQVHQSNFRVVGYTEAPRTAELAGLGPPLVADIGSGLLDSRCPWLDRGPPPWLDREPAARQTLEAGAALVTFSGDKLLGGPQAGIIAGRADLVEACRRHRLARALRPGSLVLAALQQTALAYLRQDGQAIDFWRMAAPTPAQLRERLGAYEGLQEVSTAATPGGGTLPGVEIESVGVAVPGDHVSRLRSRPRPIIARVADGATVVDLRTVHPDDDAEVAAALREAADVTEPPA